MIATKITTVVKGLGADAEKAALLQMEIGVERGALMLEGAIKLILTGTRSGRTYPVPRTAGRDGRGVPHVASAPGEAPAVLFGTLRNSIVHTPAVRKRARGAGGKFAGGISISSEVGVREGSPAQRYAARLEFGGFHRQGRDQAFRTMEGWRMVRAGTLIRTLARPYLRPATDRMTPVIEAMWMGLLS